MNTQPLNILVVDDQLNHRRAAETLLKGHNLTVVGSYDEGVNLLLSGTTYDVVLLDLMMPASAKAQGGEGMNFVGKILPVGTFLILLAMNAGVKRIGMVTDTNHHHHPASAALDPINRKVIKVGDTWIFATNYPGSTTFDTSSGEMVPYEFLRSEEGKLKYPKGDGGNREGTFEGKGWGCVLSTLLSGGDEDGGC